MNTTTDKTLCLAHPPGHTDMRKSPATWCEKYRTCARHQSISLSPFDGSGTVHKRLCLTGQTNAFVPLDGPPEGGQ